MPEPIILQAEPFVRSSYELGEGSLWNEELSKLMHVDILGRSAGLVGPDGTLMLFPMPATIGTIVARKQGGALVALANSIAALDFDTGALTPFGDGLVHPATNRCNDGKVGPDGRFYFGTMHSASIDPRPPVGKLYVMDTDGSIRTLLDCVVISNGLAWSLDHRTMYYIDTPTLAVQAFDFDKTKGTISNGRIAFPIPPGTGNPDGCTMDAEGMLWVAQWGGSRVVRYDPSTGQVLAIIRVPTAHVSSVTFGGPSYEDIYITTAKEFMDEATLAEQPHAGDIFVVRGSGFKGIAAPVFQG